MKSVDGNRFEKENLDPSPQEPAVIRVVLTISLALAPSLLAAADWPAWRGPDGNGSAPPIGAALIDDAARARKAWTSEEAIPDTYVADARAGKKAAGIAVGGGYAAPIVVGDAVYQFYYLPGGEAVDEGAAAKNAGRDRANWKILADDVVLCLDARTGKTRWKTVLAGKGINVNAAFNKGGGLLTPCHGDGRIYAVGTGALMYCLDAGNGDLLWESPIGGRHADMEAAKEEALAEGKLIYFNRDLGGACAFVGGVVATNDYAEYYRKRNDVGCGLAGFDAESGRHLWTVDGSADWHAAPVPWTHAGEDHFLVANKHAVSCVRAPSGEVSWRCEEGGSGVAVAVDGDLMVCNGPKRTDGKKGLLAGLSCFRISADGAEKLWSLDPSIAYGGSAPAIHRGRVYLSTEKKLLCVSLEDGSVLGELPGGGVYASPVAAGGRLFLHGSGKSGNPLVMYRADAQGLEPLGEFPDLTVANSTTPAIANGALFVRARDRLMAFSLTR